MTSVSNRRILVVDDNEAIQADYRKILPASAAVADVGLIDLEADLFGDDDVSAAPAASVVEPYEITTASQGQEALELVKAACAEGRPFAMVFMDVRMPPGWDGVETLEHIWKVDPNLQAVICTAFSDYSWSETVSRLGNTDRLLILKKPFDSVEVCQLASSLVEKWNLVQRERTNLEHVLAAEREARAYAASLETVNQAMETTLATTEESARAKSEFLMHVTHKLLAPMASLLGKAERLERKDNEAEWMSTVEEVCRDGSVLRLLLGDIVDLADIESNQFHVELATCAPLDIAREAIDSSLALAAEKGVTITCGCDSPVPATIESDAARFHRLLSILVENAVERSPRGEVVNVRFNLERTASWQDSLLCIEIHDRGAGIPKDRVGQLFEPFQSDGRLSLELGLAKRLAHLLGGDILAKPGLQGSQCFALTVRTGALDGVSLFEATETQT